MLARFRKIAYLMAYAVATIPLWHYIRDGRILALMTIVVVFAYIMVVLTTVQDAQAILSSEKAKIAFPRWLPDKPKYHKWWMLVRHTLKWHLLLIPAKMGLALGFVQWLHSYWMGVGFEYTAFSNSILLFLRPYFYESYFLPDPVSYSSFVRIFPQWETIILTVVMLIAFSIAGCFLTASVAINILSFQSGSKHKLILSTIWKYSITLLGILGFLYILTTYYSKKSYNHCLLKNTECTFEEKREQYNVIDMKYRRNVRIGETLYTSIFTFIDNGILLGANIMRPVGENTEFASIWEHDENGNLLRVGYDNRPFVARQIVAGILGLLLYAGTTWVILWFVEDEPKVT